MQSTSTTSRLIPFTVAGIICFISSFILGASFWYFFGTNQRTMGGGNVVVQTSNQNSLVSNANADNSNANVAPPAPTPALEIKKAPAGEIKITGGEVALGGGDTKLPARRVAVEDFMVGETEVTNAQYAAFVEAAKHQVPSGWKDGKFVSGAENMPVVGVTWADANAYCEWLSKELNATVRLPSEAEWERAAGGDTNYKYPWGNDWNDEAAQNDEKNGKILPVKSLTAGRSPFGVYEMIGNVWEWTSDLAVDEFDKPVLFGNSKQRIIKGGWAREKREFLTIDARAARPEDKASELLGFRYIVIRKQ